MLVQARSRVHHSLLSRLISRQSLSLQALLDYASVATCMCIARPSPALFALIKFRLSSHRLRVETDRRLPVKTPLGQRICRHCNLNAVVNEQHFLFDCPFYSGIWQQHTALFGSDQGSIRLFLERNADQTPLVAHYIHLCFQARMSDESHLAPQPGL